MTKLTLSKPIQAHGAEISELDISEPTGKDVRELGFPYKHYVDGSIQFLADKTAAYLVRLSKIPMSSVDQMSPADINNASMVLSNFFQ
jgi:hypothetical protein